MENTEDLKWEKKTQHINVDKYVAPLVNNLILIIEEEKKRTLQQIEDVKRLLEKIKNQ